MFPYRLWRGDAGGALAHQRNAHWATNVTAGAVLGYLSAKGTSHLYDGINLKLRIRRQRLLINLKPGFKSAEVNATLVF